MDEQIETFEDYYDSIDPNVYSHLESSSIGPHSYLIDGDRSYHENGSLECRFLPHQAYRFANKYTMNPNACLMRSLPSYACLWLTALSSPLPSSTPQKGHFRPYHENAPHLQTNEVVSGTSRFHAPVLTASRLTNLNLYPAFTSWHDAKPSHVKNNGNDSKPKLIYYNK
jgi:hypothetical protein